MARERRHRRGCLRGPALDRRGFVGLAMKAALAGAGAISLGSLSGCHHDKPADAMAHHVRSLRVGSDFAHPPYEVLVPPSVEGALPVVNSNLCAAGYNVFWAFSTSELMGRHAHMVDVDYEGLVSCLKRGYIDMAVSSVLNEADDPGLAFSEPYGAYELCVVCREDSPYAHARTLEELSGIRMGARVNTELDRAIDAVPGAVRAASYVDWSTGVQEVLAGTIDGTVVDRAGFSALQDAFPGLVLVPVEVPAYRQVGGLRVAVRAEDRDLLEDLNAAIQAMGEDERESLWARGVESCRPVLPRKA